MLHFLSLCYRNGLNSQLFQARSQPVVKTSETPTRIKTQRLIGSEQLSKLVKQPFAIPHAEFHQQSIGSSTFHHYGYHKRGAQPKQENMDVKIRPKNQTFRLSSPIFWRGRMEFWTKVINCNQYLNNQNKGINNRSKFQASLSQCEVETTESSQNPKQIICHHLMNTKNLPQNYPYLNLSIKQDDKVPALRILDELSSQWTKMASQGFNQPLNLQKQSGNS